MARKEEANNHTNRGEWLIYSSGIAKKIHEACNASNLDLLLLGQLNLRLEKIRVRLTQLLSRRVTFIKVEVLGFLRFFKQLQRLCHVFKHVCLQTVHTFSFSCWCPSQFLALCLYNCFNWILYIIVVDKSAGKHHEKPFSGVIKVILKLNLIHTLDTWGQVLLFAALKPDCWILRAWLSWKTTYHGLCGQTEESIYSFNGWCLQKVAIL